ncbi:MAG: hypothetical protein V2B15_08070 [Bacteroidota bacterium]
MKSGIKFSILLLLVVSGCEINQKEVLPEDGFVKIYNHPDELLSYYPESVIEISDGGYLFISAVKDGLSEIEYPTTQLVRTDQAGVVIWAERYNWLAPSSKLVNFGSSIGFVAMDLQLNAFAILVDPSSGEVREQHDLEMTLPLFSFGDGQGNLVVLGYDFVSRSSWISKFNNNLGLERSNKLAVNADMDLLIQRHLNKTGQEFPFFIGEYSSDAGTGYYVSCFSNYTLRTMFLDISSLNATGNVFSFQTDEAISAVIHKTGSLFSLSGYYEGNNYLVPEADIDVGISQSIKDFQVRQLYELTNKAKVVSEAVKSGSDEFALFASQTNANSIVIYQYAMDSDSLVMTHHRYFDERVEVSDIIQTADGGIAILGQIHVLGKYKRSFLLKEPKELLNPED